MAQTSYGQGGKLPSLARECDAQASAHCSCAYGTDLFLLSAQELLALLGKLGGCMAHTLSGAAEHKCRSALAVLPKEVCNLE
jgi:hypothetical protein